VKELFAPIFRRIDHQPLHELPGLDQPDTASLAKWVWTETRDVLPLVKRLDLYERRGCGVILSAVDSEVALPI
jgi:6-pyruvoyltetrahydropterin/6-carboxytetrahydropterin synthase